MYPERKWPREYIAQFYLGLIVIGLFLAGFYLVNREGHKLEANLSSVTQDEALKQD